MSVNPCYFCGATPIIEEVSPNYWNATHHECLGEPGVSICNNAFADHAINAWNKWQIKMAVEFPRNAAEQNVHLTAFGVQPSRSIPLQLSLFADDLSATIGGR